MKRSRGQATVEMALVLIVGIIPLTLGLIAFAEIGWTYHVLATLTRIGARYAARRVGRKPIGAEQIDAQEAPVLVHVAREHEHARVPRGSGASEGRDARAPRVTHRGRSRVRCVQRGGRVLGRAHRSRRHLEPELRAPFEDGLRDAPDGARTCPAQEHHGRGPARARRSVRPLAVEQHAEAVR